MFSVERNDVHAFDIFVKIYVAVAVFVWVFLSETSVGFFLQIPYYFYCRDCSVTEIRYGGNANSAIFVQDCFGHL